MLYTISTRSLQGAITALEIAEAEALTNAEEYASQHGKEGYSRVKQVLLDTAVNIVHQSLCLMRESLKRTEMARKNT